jgi:hypothetical protein
VGPTHQCPILPCPSTARIGRCRATHPRPPAVGHYRSSPPVSRAPSFSHHVAPSIGHPPKKSLHNTPSPPPLLPIHHRCQRTTSAPISELNDATTSTSPMRVAPWSSSAAFLPHLPLHHSLLHEPAAVDGWAPVRKY